MADDLGWESVVLVAVGENWCVHPPSISHSTAAQQVDNTVAVASFYRKFEAKDAKFGE
jgi:hypothetical protein